MKKFLRKALVILLAAATVTTTMSATVFASDLTPGNPAAAAGLMTDAPEMAEPEANKETGPAEGLQAPVLNEELAEAVSEATEDAARASTPEAAEEATEPETEEATEPETEPETEKPDIYGGADLSLAEGADLSSGRLLVSGELV